MTKEGLLLCCKQCKGVLVEQGCQFYCKRCSQVYPVREGIVLMEEKGARVDLRIGENILDLYELRRERKYYGGFVRSNVEYAARLQSINFSNYHTELLAPYMANSIVLDVGCGQLPYIEYFPDTKIKEFYGLDLSLESLKIARRRFKGAFPLTLIMHGFEDIPFQNTSVDMVVSSEVLEHLDHPHQYLNEIYRVMKKGSYLSLSTPCASMYWFPHNLLYMATKPLGWIQKLNSHKFWEKALHWHPGLRPKILRKWVEDIGFSILRHETRLWYYHTPLRIMWRLFSSMEKIGFSYAGDVFSKYLRMMERLLRAGIPIIKWLGIRQFVLCTK